MFVRLRPKLVLINFWYNHESWDSWEEITHIVKLMITSSSLLLYDTIDWVFGWVLSSIETIMVTKTPPKLRSMKEHTSTKLKCQHKAHLHWIVFPSSTFLSISIRWGFLSIYYLKLSFHLYILLWCGSLTSTFKYIQYMSWNSSCKKPFHFK